MKKWPVTRSTRDRIEKCEIHIDEKLKLFCGDHDQLCCNTCISLNHRQCAKVSLITDLVQITSHGDQQQLYDDIKTILQQLTNLRKSQEVNITSLQKSFKKIEQEIKDARQKMNAALDELEKITLTELDNSMAMFMADFNTGVDNCAKLYEELKEFRDIVHDIGENNNELVFVANAKLLQKKKQSESYIQEHSGKQGISLSFQTNINIEKYLSELRGLGKIIRTDLVNPDRALSVIGKTEYNVKSKNDYDTCAISGVWCLPNGPILLTNFQKCSLKLLDQQYKVISRFPLVSGVHDICHIGSSEVAITLNDETTHEVQFFAVDKELLVKGRVIRFKHPCIGIAHRLGELYITSRSALYKYNLRGELAKILYEDSSHTNSVFRCALSQNGEKIYVIDRGNNKLLTLAMDGTVVSTFSDSDMLGPWNVHVSAKGHVLVCGDNSRTLIQIDSEGNRKIATLAREKDGLIDPTSVFYNTHTDSVIVGQWNNNNIIVLKVK